MSFKFSPSVRVISAFLLCLGILAPAPLPAQDEDLDFSEMSLEDLLNVEVTVASKSKETLADAPSSVTVFTRQEILNMGVKTVEELLNFVPGFQTGRTDEDIVIINSPAVRGRRANSTGYDVLLLLDGQRLNEMWTGGAWSAHTHMTIANIKQVEVIRGPGSALYGSNAFFGVVNIVTETDTNDAYVGFGNNDSFEAYANFSQKIGDMKFSIFARTYSDAGDHYDDTEGLADWLGNPTATNDPMEATDIYTTLHYKSFRLNLRHTERNFEDWSMIGIVNKNSSFALEETSSANFSWEAVNNEKWQVKLDGGYIEDFREDVVPLFAPGVAQSIGIASVPDRLIGGDFFKENETRVAVDATYSFSEKGSISTGVSYREATIDIVNFETNFDAQALFSFNWPVDVFTDISPEHGGPKGNAGSRDILGFYIQGKFQLHERLSATAGVRYDDYSDFGDTINPRGALIYSAPFNAKFKAMYGEAFRAPSRREQSEVSLIFVGNPNLQPEEVTTLEFAWIQKWGKAVQTTLTYFDTDLTDGVAFVLGEIEGFQAVAPFNVVDASFSGIEFEAQVAFSTNAILRANYTTLSDTEENPTKLGETTMSFAFNYNPSPWNFNLSGYFHDEVETLPIETGGFVTLSDFWVINSTVSLTIGEKFSIMCKANNLLDEDYRTYSASIGNLPTRGRELSLGAGIKF